MKIALSPDEVASLSGNSGAQVEAMEQAVRGCKTGDWEAKHALERQFSPLITKLAIKRAGADIEARNELIERGRAGLYRAAKRFPARESVRHFRLYALDEIEAAMDNPLRGLARFWDRLRGPRK